ncbi:DUF2267 domain-containing protein [uncultured Hyphomicrobium sp.]|jgi:uncharacterized protein (DUF2267 family)|uniref:DUF2267 domain-containing protein n=1 Tax=uncultured Hyphomicrobium sp. TaxID=194373 RepID=UPI0025D55C48|nr:DUF2267 domain-containing protein [uncultured Hyphomicrobium sp.]
MTLPPSIMNSLQKTREWLKELRDNADLEDDEEALSVLRVVLHQLRDRLPPDEAANLGAQLPNIIRGLYYESWKPSVTPLRIHSKRTFLEEVAPQLRPQRNEPYQVVRDVFAYHCDPGEISHVINQLPSDIKSLWPNRALNFRRQISPDNFS